MTKPVIWTRDDGPGIPIEGPSRREPFFTTKFAGADPELGLMTSHRMAGDRPGGEIEFESRFAETRFKVRLPFHCHP